MELREYYLRSWELVLTNLLGWSIPEIHRWAEKWLRDPGDMFFHESPIYYASAVLIPADVWQKRGAPGIWPIVSEVQRALLDFHPSQPYDWAAARERLSKVFDDARNSPEGD
jgi:hypothetical protein